MKEAGHDVHLVLKNNIEVLKMLERVIITDEMRKNKSIGKLMSREEKIEFIRNWKDKKQLLLEESGLIDVTGNVFVCEWNFLFNQGST